MEPHVQNTFLSLSADVQKLLCNRYLQECSISVALLRCTCRAIYRTLSDSKRTIRPTLLDGCTLDVIKSMLPAIDATNIDSWHWDGLFCNALEAQNVKDVIRLLKCFKAPSEVFGCHCIVSNAKKVKRVFANLVTLMSTLDATTVKTLWDLLPYPCIGECLYIAAIQHGFCDLVKIAHSNITPRHDLLPIRQWLTVGQYGDIKMFNTLSYLYGERDYRSLSYGAAIGGNIPMLEKAFECCPSLCNSVLFTQYFFLTDNLPQATVDFFLKFVKKEALVSIFNAAAKVGHSYTCRQLLQYDLTGLVPDFGRQCVVPALARTGVTSAQFFWDLCVQYNVPLFDTKYWLQVFKLLLSSHKYHEFLRVAFVIDRVGEQPDGQGVLKDMLRMVVESGRFYKNDADALFAKLAGVKPWSVYWKHLLSWCVTDEAFEWVCTQCSIKVDESLATRCLTQTRFLTDRVFPLSDSQRSLPILRWLGLGAPLKCLYDRSGLEEFGSLPKAVLKVIVKSPQIPIRIVRLAILFLIKHGEYLFIKSIYKELIEPSVALVKYLQKTCLASNNRSAKNRSTLTMQAKIDATPLDYSDELDLQTYDNICLWPADSTLPYLGNNHKLRSKCIDTVTNGNRRLYYWLRQVLQ